MENLKRYSVQRLDRKTLTEVDGGGLKGWGWLGVAAYIAGEITDYVTSDGENIKGAFQNGYEAGLR